jgi:hypothetical protein
MSALKGCRALASIAVVAALAGCATNRILRCEGHLVAINPPPPKPAMGTPAPAEKPHSPRSEEHKP